MLIDCGEGTQRQMMRYGFSFALGDLFFTHYHTDHVLGTLGLLRTLTLQGRAEPLRLWGPPDCMRFSREPRVLVSSASRFRSRRPRSRRDADRAQRIFDPSLSGRASRDLRSATRSSRKNAADASIPNLPARCAFPKARSGAARQNQPVTLPDGRTIDPALSSARRAVAAAS